MTITYAPKIDARGADAAAVGRLAVQQVRFQRDFERNVRAVLDRAEPRKALERALLAKMGTAGEMQWGKDDCALWCANILKDALGYDGAERFRGRYRTRIGARRVLGKGGLASALRAAARKHKWRRIKVGQEQVGDIGILMLGEVPVTVICRASGWFVARNETGWSAMPSKLCG